MQQVQLLVDLKIPDVTALTAGNTLRRRLGYAHSLRRLKRTEYYLLSLDVPTEQEAFALADELAARTDFFVNPNKHQYTIRQHGQDTTPRQEHGVWVVEALVTDAEGAAAGGILSALQGRAGYGDRVAGVERGTLWTLELECADAGEAAALADEIVVTRTREKGLLMNPHYQVWQAL